MEFTYDDNQNLLSETEFAGGDPVVPWMPHYKAEYSWNPDNSLVSKVCSNYYVDEAAWVPVYKYEFVYNMNGCLMTQTESSWHKIASSWEFNYQYEYDYGLNWRLVMKSELGWNNDLAEWENRYKTNYTYNAIDKIGTLTRYWWNNEGMQWQYSHMQEYVYDLAGNQLRETGSYWDSFASAWRNDRKKECEYNLAVTYDELISPHDMGIFSYISRNMMTNVSQYKNINGNWIEDFHYSYYYHPFSPSGIEETSISEAIVFPNPARQNVVFSWVAQEDEKELEIYDFSGKIVLQTRIRRDLPINISHFPAGSYFYTLKQEGILPLKGKIIKLP